MKIFHLCIVLILSACASAPPIRHFSETQIFDHHYLEEIDAKPFYLPKNWQSQISLPPPPSLEETKKEITYLKSLVPKRANKEQILAEICICGQSFGGISVGDAIEYAAQDKSLSQLFYRINADAARVGYYFKRQYDRIRPSHFDPSLSILIQIPGHPAYPSGHSTIAHTIANMLMDLEDDPAVREQIWRDATAIAHNREIAGLHYPSDSAAGKILGAQIYALFKQNPEFVELEKRARVVWQQLRKDLQNGSVTTISKSASCDLAGM